MPLLQRSVALVALAIAASAWLAAGQATGAAPGASYRGTVVSVGDGDTLRVSTGGRSITIRLACIDAPETAQSPWGMQSRASLMQRLPRGRQVSILPHTTDRYGRTVAELISDINLVMVEDGQAYPLRGPAAMPTGAISRAVTPRGISMRSSGPAGTAMGYGRCRAASLARGTSAIGVPPW